MNETHGKIGMFTLFVLGLCLMGFGYIIFGVASTIGAVFFGIYVSAFGE